MTVSLCYLPATIGKEKGCFPLPRTSPEKMNVAARGEGANEGSASGVAV